MCSNQYGLDATRARIDGGADNPGYFTEKRICYYINPNGSDNNSGLSATTPLQSLTGALLKMKDATTGYTLYIDGTLTGKQSISPQIIDGHQYSISAKSLILCGLTSEAKIDAGCDENNTGSALRIGQAGFPITIANLTITGGYTGNGGGISFYNMSGYDCTLTLAEGAVITGNTATGYGGGIYIQDGPVSLVINGGTVSGNNAAYGGGVYYGNGSGNFTMNSGTISGNTANDGGGVYLGRSFNMKGGEISENTAQRGGAVCYGSYGILYMSGNAKIPFGVNGQQVPGKNDVYLAYNSSKPDDIVVKVDGALTDGDDAVATITPNVWHRGMTVLRAASNQNGGITEEIAARFAMSDPEFTISTREKDGETLGYFNAPIYVASSTTRKTCTGEPGSNDANGTLSKPYASLSQAANQLKEPIDFTILIDGEITGENARFAFSDGLKKPTSMLLKGANGDNTNDKLDRALTAATDNGSVIDIGTNISRFEIQDLTITGGNTTGNGGGISIWCTSLYLGKGAMITGNQAEGNGGGVYVSTTSKLFMYADAKIGEDGSEVTATIFANKAKNGGGVCAKEGGSVYLGYTGLDTENQPVVATGDNAFTGGIFGNYATENGGGMAYESTAGDYYMADGSIGHNAAASNGGGVYIPEDKTYGIKTFNMSGGTVHGNAATTGGAVYVGGTFNMSGSAVVNSNNDVYLTSDTKVTIAGPLSNNNVATITPADYTRTDALLFVPDDAGTSLENEYGKFAVTENSGKCLINKEGKLLPPGALVGKFSVASNKQVYFSQGNLQYQANNGEGGSTWQFAEDQYTYIGSESGNTTPTGRDTQNDWIDLFGWATSGYNDKFPYMISTNNSDYGPGSAVDITGDNAEYDWGVHNAISNGGNAAHQWRTLTRNEWDYLLNTRETEGPRYAKVMVHGVKGLVLLPDDWNSSIASFTNDFQAVTDAEWNTIETAGAVFLPCAGRRYGDNQETYPYPVQDSGSDGLYWTTSSYRSVGNAGFLEVSANGVSASSYQSCAFGFSVRLVQDVK